MCHNDRPVAHKLLIALTRHWYVRVLSRSGSKAMPSGHTAESLDGAPGAVYSYGALIVAMHMYISQDAMKPVALSAPPVRKIGQFHPWSRWGYFMRWFAPLGDVGFHKLCFRTSCPSYLTRHPMHRWPVLSDQPTAELVKTAGDVASLGE